MIFRKASQDQRYLESARSNINKTYLVKTYAVSANFVTLQCIYMSFKVHAMCSLQHNDDLYIIFYHISLSFRVCVCLSVYWSVSLSIYSCLHGQ